VDSFSALTFRRGSRCAPLQELCTAFWESHGAEAYNILTPKFVTSKRLTYPPCRGRSCCRRADDDRQRQSAAHCGSLRRSGSADGCAMAWLGFDLFDQIPGAAGFRRLARGQSRHGQSRLRLPLPHQDNSDPVELSDQLASVKQALGTVPATRWQPHRLWAGAGGYFTLYRAWRIPTSSKGVSGRSTVTDGTTTLHYRALHGFGRKTSDTEEFAGQLAAKLPNCWSARPQATTNVHMQNTIQNDQSNHRDG